MRLAATFLALITSAFLGSGLATGDDGSNPKKPAHAAPSATLREDVHALRASVDRLRTDAAAGAHDPSVSAGLAARARSDARRLERLEKRLAAATPPAEKLKRRANDLEHRLERARTAGDAATTEKLERELVATRRREAALAEHPQQPPASPEALERRSHAMLARADEVARSGDETRADALRKSAAALSDRAEKLRAGGATAPTPRPMLSAEESAALRTELASVRAELRRVRASLHDAGTAPEHGPPPHPGKKHGDGKQV